MNPIELRKIIVVGMRFDAPNDSEVDPKTCPVRVRVAFWIPQAPPFQRCAYESDVINVKPFEAQSLTDGAITEVVQEFVFPSNPSPAEMFRRLMPVWEGLTYSQLGSVPNGAPIDRDPNKAIAFSRV